MTATPPDPESVPASEPDSGSVPDAAPGQAKRPDRFETVILELATACGPARSICPSEVARAIRPDDWRPLMNPVRHAALRLQAAGQLEILRKGKPVSAAEVRGVIRLRVPGSAADGDAE